MSDEYVATLRCQTWNVWPEKAAVEYRPFIIPYGAATPLVARLMIFSYAPRSRPELFLKEETKLGPLIWDGETRGLHHSRDTILKAPEDVVKLAFQYRNAQRGEVDVCINLRFEGALPSQLIESLHSSVYAIVSLLNLRLNDYLTAAAPFQVRKVLPNGKGEMESTVLLAVHARQSLEKENIEKEIASIARILCESPYGDKFRIALELYAAHFTEQQVRVRFLMLVIAIESLAKASEKHQVAVDLLARWQHELDLEMSRYPSETEEYLSLEALSRELEFRKEDSIRSQVRKLFTCLPGVSPAEASGLQRRALRVYDKRSSLVHDGHLPAEELSILEGEARELLEMLFTSAMLGIDEDISISL